MEAQPAQLPLWYLPSAWDAIEIAVDNIDLPTLMIPICQKYVSQEDATWLIRLTVMDHQSEWVEAKTKYDAEHPQDSKSSSPQ